jgi:NAD(P)-dependent dehydrogenase (short-subunit alcohol dehydrogenase family)
MIKGVGARCGGMIDGLIVCAGTSVRLPITMAVNFFGAVATIEGFRPMLAKSSAPRVAVITSYAATMPLDDALVDAALVGDELGTLALADGKDVKIYTSSKAALTIWCRRAAVRAEWAGSGILLNMVAPGMVDTPMVARRLHDPAAFAEFKTQMPLPLDRYGQPGEVAELLIFLASEVNSYLVGQHIFIDGGTEALVRGARRY